MVRRGDVGIRHRRDPARPRHRLDQNVLPFAVEFGREQTDSSHVAARARERGYQPFRDHVFAHADERHGPRGGLQRAQRELRAGDDRVGCHFDQRRCRFGKLLVSDLGAAENDGEILPLDKAIAAQFVQ